MRFIWQARRVNERPRIGALVTSIALTCLAGAIFGAAFRTPLAALRISASQLVVRAYERIVFVSTAPPRAVAARVRAEVATMPAPASATSSAPAAVVDTGTARDARPTESAEQPRRQPSSDEGSDSPARTQGIGPVLAPVGLRTESVFTSEQRDSVLGVTSRAVPFLAAKLKPTQEQKDSVGREVASIFARARDEKRPVALPVAGGGIPFPLFSRGKSKAERTRDSIVHDDNLRRLGRLALLVKAKADSARRADSIASLKTSPADSMED